MLNGTPWRLAADPGRVALPTDDDCRHIPGRPGSGRAGLSPLLGAPGHTRAAAEIRTDLLAHA
eukprot:866361-Lingulodinium_polyedra.AAC.1